jgi:hypothetical protein
MVRSQKTVLNDIKFLIQFVLKSAQP